MQDGHQKEKNIFGNWRDWDWRNWDRIVDENALRIPLIQPSLGFPCTRCRLISARKIIYNAIDLSLFLARSSALYRQFIGDITNIYFRGRRFFLSRSRSIFFRPTRSRLQFAPSRSPFLPLSPSFEFNPRACLSRAPNYLLTRREWFT